MMVRAPSPSPRRALAVLVPVLVLVLAGCGGGDGDAAAPGGVDGALVVAGTDGLRFEPDALSAPAGVITIELVCGAGANHNLVIEDTDEQVAACAPGQRGVGSVELGPGSYVLVCTVPGHEAVMRGRLSVS